MRLLQLYIYNLVNILQSGRFDAVTFAVSHVITFQPINFKFPDFPLFYYSENKRELQLKSRENTDKARHFSSLLGCFHLKVWIFQYSSVNSFRLYIYSKYFNSILFQCLDFSSYIHVLWEFDCETALLSLQYIYTFCDVTRRIGG